MKLKLLGVLVLGALLQSAAYAAEGAYNIKQLCKEQREAVKKLEDSADRYHEKLITPTLIAWECQPDAATLAAIEDWMYTNRGLIKRLVDVPVYDEDRKIRYQAASTMLKVSGFQNLSRGNFIIPISLQVNEQTKKYVVKIAGAGNRRENYNAHLGRGWGQPVTRAEYGNMALDTYQGVSRGAHYLKAKEWIEQNPEAGITVPTTYLVRIPGAKTHVSDDNYLVVEEWVPSVGSAEYRPQAFLNCVPAVAQFMAYVGIWEAQPRHFGITQEGRVVYLDLEQPNNSKPQDFFHKNKYIYGRNVGVGLGELQQTVHALQVQVQAEQYILGMQDGLDCH